MADGGSLAAVQETQSEKLASVEAEDGLLLTGFEAVPASPRETAFVWIHGFGVGYDLPECVRLGRELAGRGFGFVAGNVRGHDGGAVGWRSRAGRVETIRVGSWWEVFEESALDIAAWVRHSRSLGFEQVVLCGHSFGALRAVYYVSERKGGGVDGLVLASTSFGLRHLDAATAVLANQLVADGEGERLLPAGSWPRGFGTDTVSAQTYASWWRVAPRFFGEGRSRFADIRCPTLILYGAAGDVGGEAEIDYIRGLLSPSLPVDSRLLPDVRHRYAGGEATIGSALADWVRTANYRAASSKKGWK